MMIWLSAAAVILLAAGYAAYCSWFAKSEPERSFRAVFGLNRQRVCYLVVGALLFAAVIGMLLAFYRESAWKTLRLLALTAVLLPSAAVDFRCEKIPNRFLLAGLILRILLLAAELVFGKQEFPGMLTDYVIGALIIGGFFLLIHFVFRNGIGMGDVKLLALVGFYTGLWGAAAAVFFSITVSFIAAVILLIFKKKTRQETIPFGPCVLLGTVLSICLTGL